MATELAKAYVQIIPSAKGIQGGISNVLNGEAGSAGDQAGQTLGASLISKIKGVIATAGIGAALKSALTEGANLEQSLGGIETLFKDSANTVITNAKNAYMTAGMSANEYMETVTSFSASLLQGLSGDTAQAADVADMALRDMSDNANKMGTSMELIQNAYQGFAKQNYTMLDNLKLGYGGTKTEMERLLADAEKLTGVKYDINNLSDVYSAIHAIQEEMGITGTTAEEAAATFSGSLASMKAAASNVLANLALGEGVGESLAALQTTVHTFVFGNLMPMVGNVLSALPEVVGQASILVSTSLNNIRNNMGTIIETGIEMVTGLAASIITGLPYIAESSLLLIGEFCKVIAETDWVSVGTDFISRLSMGMTQVAAEIFGADGNVIDAFITFVEENFPSILNQGVEMITNLANGILNSIPMIIEQAGNVISTFLDFIIANLPSVLSAGIDLTLNLANGIINSLPKIASAAVTTVAKLLSTVLNNAPTLIEGGITLIGKLAAGIIQAVPSLIGKIPGIISQIKSSFSSIDWGSVGRNIISGIARGISNGVGSIISAAKSAAESALRAAKNALGIHSPSKVFENEVGKMIDTGLAAGIKNNVSAVADSMKELSRATVGMVNTDFEFSTQSVQPAVGIGYSNQNIEELLNGVVLQIINKVTVDGTPLKEMASEYTVNRISTQQVDYMRAKGALV